jgi:hypothetical protein
MFSIVLTVSDGVDVIWRVSIRSINRQFSWFCGANTHRQAGLQPVANDLVEALKTIARDFRGPK